jgi:hypothetical protein
MFTRVSTLGCVCCYKLTDLNHGSRGQALDAPECQPGEPAPQTGQYQLLNVFGTPTGERVHIEQGAPAPDALRGHVWRLVSRD